VRRATLEKEECERGSKRREEKKKNKNGQFGLRHSHSAVSSSTKVGNTALFYHPEGVKTS